MRRILVGSAMRNAGLAMLAVLFGQAIALAETSETVAPAVASEPVVSDADASQLEPDASVVAEEYVGEQDADGQTQPRPLFQHAAYPDAWKAAQESNRPILVYVSMPNCHYCVKMKQQVLGQPRITRLVADSFETVHADKNKHTKLVQSLRVKWYPTTVLVSPNNKILDVIEGYVDANKFQQRVQTSLASLKQSATETQTR